jgi:hypothetical protein
MLDGSIPIEAQPAKTGPPPAHQEEQREQFVVNNGDACFSLTCVLAYHLVGAQSCLLMAIN